MILFVAEGNELLLEKMEFPEPVIDMAIEPKSKADREKLANALGCSIEEDPTFRVIYQRRDRTDHYFGYG